MVESSVGSSKRPRVEPTVEDMPTEEIPYDPTTAIAENDVDVDEVDVETSDAKPTVPPPLSLRAMMKSFIMTQAAHRQLLDELITEVTTLRADFTEYRSVFPPPPSNF